MAVGGEGREGEKVEGRGPDRDSVQLGNRHCVIREVRFSQKRKRRREERKGSFSP